MKHQSQPSAWSCFPTALGMCTDTPVAQIIHAVGHDGSAVVRPGESPYNRRGFHFNELVCWGLAHNWALINVDLSPRFDDLIIPPPTRSQVINLILNNTTMLGLGKHIVACDRLTVYDPRFHNYSFALNLDLVLEKLIALVVVRRLANTVQLGN